MKKVFLGGTCNGSKWRDLLIPMLSIDYFNPVVEDWTPECQLEEIKQRNECDYVLYIITPKIKGVYSIAEVVEDSIKRPDKTIFCVLHYDNGVEFESHILDSLNAVKEMVKRNGANVFDNMYDVVSFLNY